MLENERIEQLALLLYEAEREVKPVSPLSDLEALDEVDAYAIQTLNINRKLQEGSLIVGKKIGLTSIAMQEMIGVDTPDFGILLDNMDVKNGQFLTNRLLQPKVEAEIAFVLKADLTGPNLTIEDVIEATDYVVASFEIVDSRIKDWKIKLTDTVSDNASSGQFVLGTKKIDPKVIDLREVEMNFYKNGELINSGKGSAALGHPAFCVAWLGNKLASYGVSLKKGEVILSGALSAALPASKGDTFRAEFSELGSVIAQFV